MAFHDNPFDNLFRFLMFMPKGYNAVGSFDKFI